MLSLFSPALSNAGGSVSLNSTEGFCANDNCSVIHSPFRRTTAGSVVGIFVSAVPEPASLALLGIAFAEDRGSEKTHAGLKTSDKSRVLLDPARMVGFF